MALSPEQLSALAIGTGGLAELGAGYAGMRAGRARAGYARTAAGINRDFARLQAGDVRERGGKAATELLRRANRLAGTQRANLAAQGIDVNSGSALDAQVDSQVQARLDANEMTSSAWRQAWGMEAQAENEYASDLAGADAMDFDADSTFLTGGLRFVNSLARGYDALDLKKKLPSGRVQMPEYTGAGRYQGAY